MDATPECRIPKSGERGRNALEFAKILESVDRDATEAFMFRGKIVRAGALIPESDLATGAVVLECCEVLRTPHDRRRRWTRKWILWRWEAERRGWAQVASCTADDSSWVVVLCVPARMALGNGWEISRPVPEHVERIAYMLDREIQELDPSQRLPVINEMITQLYSRACKAADQLPYIADPGEMEILKRGPRRADVSRIEETFEKAG